MVIRVIRAISQFGSLDSQCSISQRFLDLEAKNGNRSFFTEAGKIILDENT